MNKKLFLLLITIGFITNIGYSQTVKIDTLVGSKGLFSKFKPKEITANQQLSFNLKLSYIMKDKNGKVLESHIFLNTKHGYLGFLNNKKGGDKFNPDDANFGFMVYSHSQKNFIYSNNKKGKKTVMSIPINPKNDYKMENITLKKESLPSKKFTAQNIAGYAYNNSKTSAKDKVIVYFNDNSISGNYQFKDQLSFAGIGFYLIDGKTVLSTGIENNGSIMTLTKIEKVNIKLNGTEFKKEVIEGMDKMMEEMMKKDKKK
jgi:hypothetical protein